MRITTVIIVPAMLCIMGFATHAAAPANDAPLSVYQDEAPAVSADDYDPDEGETISPSESALIHDPRTNTYIVYPSDLLPCDDEDGTAFSDGIPVAACSWDDGSGRPFIVLAP